MSYDTSLLTGAQLVEHVGVLGLANVEATAELDLDTFALQAHRAIYRRLQANGYDPTALTNQEQLKDAIAYEAVGRLALAGRITGVDAMAFLAIAKESVRDFRGAFATEDAAGRTGGGVPAVGHLDGGLIFSGDPTLDDRDYFSDDTPSVR
jgi:hypothetical protein